jgi:hypothetical protein
LGIIVAGKEKEDEFIKPEALLIRQKNKKITFLSKSAVSAGNKKIILHLFLLKHYELTLK